MRIDIRQRFAEQKCRGFAQELTLREDLRILAEWAGICAVTAWLFYDSVPAFVVLFLLLPVWVRFRKDSFLAKRRRLYAKEFEEGIEALSAAVSAGYSMEHAVGEALRDLRMVHGKDNSMMEELHEMTVQMSMNQSVEYLFWKLAQESGIADAASFADVFSAAKRTGGNLVEIMEQTAQTMEEKEAVNREIEVLLAGKKYEQQIMSMIPFGIIVYIRAGSPGYLDTLYHSLSGICIMTLCLVIYGMSIYLGNKVLRIEV